LRGTVAEGQLPFAWTKLDGEDERDDAAGNAGDADRRTQKRHDGGAVAARYKHAFGGLSVRFFVGQSVRNLRILHSFSAHGRPALAHLYRLVPLHDTAAAGLQRYLARRRPRSDDDPMLIGKRGGPLRYIAVKETFDRLVGKAGIVTATRRRPRLHDLRHTFAVRALQGSPAGRSRSGAHMAALSTYMGHVNICATYWYLEATADLMRDVAAAGEGFIYDGRRS
jgi:hypothetical protein